MQKRRERILWDDGLKIIDSQPSHSLYSLSNREDFSAFLCIFFLLIFPSRRSAALFPFLFSESTLYSSFYPTLILLGPQQLVVSHTLHFFPSFSWGCNLSRVFISSSFHITQRAERREWYSFIICILFQRETQRDSILKKTIMIQRLTGLISVLSSSPRYFWFMKREQQGHFFVPFLPFLNPLKEISHLSLLFLSTSNHSLFFVSSHCVSRWRYDVRNDWICYTDTWTNFVWDLMEWTKNEHWMRLAFLYLKLFVNIVSS